MFNLNEVGRILILDLSDEFLEWMDRTDLNPELSNRVLIAMAEIQPIRVVSVFVERCPQMVYPLFQYASTRGSINILKFLKDKVVFDPITYFFPIDNPQNALKTFQWLMSNSCPLDHLSHLDGENLYQRIVHQGCKSTLDFIPGYLQILTWLSQNSPYPWGCIRIPVKDSPEICLIKQHIRKTPGVYFLYDKDS